MLALPADMQECGVLTGLCRVCASDEQPLKDIFNSEGVQQRLQIKIEVCLRIPVSEGDAMPSTVCFPCAASLNESYELVQRCIRGQEILRERLSLQSAVKPTSPQSVPFDLSLKQEYGSKEPDSDSDSSQPTLQRLQILDPHIIQPTSGTYGHSQGSSAENECLMYSNLGVLADAVMEKVQEIEPGGRSSPSQTAGPSTTPSSPAATRRKHLACEYCAKEFHHTGDLNKHRRCHTGERPYRCQECDKQFAHVSNLRRHRKLHSGERPHSCPVCQRSFSRSDRLLSHHCAAARQRP